MLRRFLLLLHVVIRTAGRAAFQRAAPLYLAIGIVAAIVFSGNGMSASDVTTFAEDSIPFRAALWLLWLSATMPAARAVLCEPSLFLLRSLPIPRTHFYVAHGLLLFAVELPFGTLFVRGIGLLLGLSLTFSAMAAHALFTLRRRSIESVLLALMLLALVLIPVRIPIPIAAPIPILLHLGMSTLVLSRCLILSFDAAPQSAGSVDRPLVGGPAVVALCLAYLLTVWRAQWTLLLRALFLVLLGLGIVYFSVHNNQLTTPALRGTISLGVLAGVLLLGLSGVAGPIRRSEREAEWLLQVCGTSGAQRIWAGALAIGLLGVLLGALHGLLLSWLLDGDWRLLLRLGSVAMAAGMIVGVIGFCLVRWAQRGTKADSDRLLLAQLFTLLVWVLLTWMFHELALLCGLLSAFWMLLWATTAATPSATASGRWLRLRREREKGDH